MLYVESWPAIAADRVREALKHRRCNVNTLPDPILVQILEISVDGDISLSRSLQLCSVCRIWRNLIHSSPSLNRIINSGTSSEVNRGIVERHSATSSGVIALVIGGYSEERMSDTIDLAAPHSERWLWLDYRNERCDKVTLAALNRAASLTTLEMSTDQVHDAMPIISLPNPSILTRLSLRGCRLDWESSRLQGLRMLALASVPGLPSVSRMLSILSESSNLTDLQLGSDPNQYQTQIPWMTALPESHISTEGTSHVSLPRLTSLRAFCLPRTYGRILLSHIQVPNTATIDVQGLYSEIFLPEMRSSFRELVQIALRPYGTLYLQYNTSRGELEISTGQLPDLSLGRACSQDPKFHMMVRRVKPSYWPYVMSTFKSDTAAKRDLVVYLTIHLPKKDITKQESDLLTPELLLADLPEIRSLIISGRTEAIEPILDFISTVESNTASLVCPGLRQLEVQSWLHHPEYQSIIAVASSIASMVQRRKDVMAQNEDGTMAPLESITTHGDVADALQEKHKLQVEGIDIRQSPYYGSFCYVVKSLKDRQTGIQRVIGRIQSIFHH